MSTPQQKPTYIVVCANSFFDTREEAKAFADEFNAKMNRHFPALANDYKATVEEVAE